VAQSVVVLSSQLITTLSALAYLRWRGLRGTQLEVVSLYRDDLSHSAKAFQPLLQDLAAQDGHDCRFIAGDSAFTEPEPRACSLLVLPRLDDREGQRMLHTYQASEVVELGESIGVETRLYSRSGRRERQRMLRRLHCADGQAVVRQDPLIPFNQPVDPGRLRCLLELCATCRAAFADSPSTNGNPAPGLMLCLPYLKLKTWRFRWRLMGRSLGWRWTLGIKNRAYFRRAIGAALRPLPADASLWVQAHPKNETHHGLIERLLAPLRSGRPWQLLPADDPLEVRLSSGWSSEASGPWQLLGFGTNLLAAAVFLAPHHRRVKLRQPDGQGWWRRCSDPWLNRREWRRSQHVGALLSNLLDALDQLQAQ
jgi:hypothetical protein